ncbi:MAG: hydrogenase maturation protease [Desulfobacteraceae bacterium]|nr:MAG: hydrogenase maturation protease [Desulfobacteraceae bacterium]
MTGDLLILGYGNPQRRDDGCGYCVAARVQAMLEEKRGVRIVFAHQLDPAMAEDLAYAREVVFVDATVEELKRGRRWRRIAPEPGFLPVLTHHLGPSFLLGLTFSIWGRCPAAWLVSIQGHDFGLGQGLSRGAARNVEKVSKEIVSFLMTKTVDKKAEFIKTYAKVKRGELQWPLVQTS